MVLSALTAGLVPDRDLAQPLITYLEGPARIELSGSTTANWISKTANLLVDGYGSPERVGFLLPLHWQTPCLLLGAVAAGATVVVADDPSGLADCSLAFTTAGTATAALDAGVDDVLACSLTPFATRLSSVPPMVLDAAAEIPSYGDHFSGRPLAASIQVSGRPLLVPRLAPQARLLVTGDPRTAAGLAELLAALGSGAAVVLAVDGADPSGEGPLSPAADLLT